MQVEQQKIQKKKSIIKIYEGNVEKMPVFVEQKVEPLQVNLFENMHQIIEEVQTHKKIIHNYLEKAEKERVEDTTHRDISLMKQKINSLEY